MFSFSWVQLTECQGLIGLLEDKQYLGREDCHVPIFGLPYYAVRITSGGLSHPSQRGETMSLVRSEGLDEFYGAQLSLFTIIHHQDHFRTVCSWFHCILKIFIKQGY
jgi:hypothetical protein